MARGSAMPATGRSLALVPDRTTGELQPVTLSSLAAENQHLRDELGELIRKFKGQSRELAELRRDRQAEAEADRLWPVAVRLFGYHSRYCRHERAVWTPERFFMVCPLLKNPGLIGCLQAIAGAMADPWRVQRKLTMFEDIFETRKKFERCLERCPAGWQPPPGVEAL